MVEPDKSEEKDSVLKSFEAILRDVPKEAKEKIEKRILKWKEEDEIMFVDAHDRYNKLRRVLLSAEDYVNLSFEKITNDLAFLSAYHEHIVRYEGILAAERVMYERNLRDNVYILLKVGAIKGRGYDELKAEAIIYYEQLDSLNEKISRIEVDMCILGLTVGKREDRAEGMTSRARAIQYIIDLYKKRHDALIKISHKNE